MFHYIVLGIYDGTNCFYCVNRVSNRYFFLLVLFTGAYNSFRVKPHIKPQRLHSFLLLFYFLRTIWHLNILTNLEKGKQGG